MFQKIKEILAAGKECLVTTHIDPDGDAVGSAFALGFALEQLGKEATVYLKDAVPYRYKFLPRPQGLVHEIPTHTFDAIFVVDCGDFFRVGDGYERLKDKGPIINVDHHDTNEAFGFLNILDQRASSTAEIIYLILRSLDVKIDANIAVNIYTGILTDTGSFRYDNTNSRAFIICEEMTRAGVVPSRVAAAVYESHPRERFELLCEALATLDTYKGNKLAIIHITQEMFNQAHSSREQSEGFVEFLKEMKGIEVAALVRETGKDRYKVSMRSKGQVDVASIANLFGGGGHKKAAGCTIEGSIEEVKKKLVEAMAF